jgi:hypothetical protein
MPRFRKKPRRSRSEWTEILRRFAASGATARQFCRREGLALSSFQRWRSRLGSVGPAEFVELIPATTEAVPVSEWSLDVALPNGVQLRFRG